MRSAVFARRLVVAITIGGAAMLLAGCGAASDNAGDIAIRPQRIQECTSQTYARVVDRLPAEAQKRVSRSKIRGAIHGFCAALAREGFLDSGNADYFRAIGVGTTLKNHPEIVRPYCRVLVDQSALTLP